MKPSQKQLYKSEQPALLHKILSPFNNISITQQVQLADVSFYQERIDWDVYATKANTVIIRIGQKNWPDVQFERNWSEAKRVGLTRGGYWFYDDRDSPKNQADLLTEMIGSDFPDMEVFIDYERTFGGNYQGLSNVVAMMKILEGRGFKVGIYTGYYFFNDHADISHFDYLKSKPLWLAWYTSNPSYVKVPLPWTKLTFWQFGTPVLGKEWGMQTLEIDMNWYNGTALEFEQRYGGSAPPPADVIDAPFPGVTRKRGDDVQVLTIEPGSIESVDVE